MYVFHPMTMCVMACEYVGVQPLSHQGCNYGAHPQPSSLIAAWQQQHKGTPHPEAAPSASWQCPLPRSSSFSWA